MDEQPSLCTKCKLTKPYACFYKYKSGKPKSRCRECVCAYAREYARSHVRSNPEKVKENRRRNYRERIAKDPDFCKKQWIKHKEKNPLSAMVSAARKEAKRRNLPFDISPSDFIIPGVCPVLGIPLRRGKIGDRRNSPSLDKVIPELGYVKGNVVVVSWRANDLKKDATIEELNKLADFYSHIMATPQSRPFSGRL